MPLIRLDDIAIEFGDTPLLRKANLCIESDERICLIGRNGAGKSTLLNIISGALQPDKGEIQRRQHLRISQLQQNLPQASDHSVFDVVKQGMAEQLALIDQYQQLSSQSCESNAELKQLEELQAAIDTGGGWNIEKQVETVITQLQLPGEKKLADLSGGWRRRVALAKAIVCQPDLLLLDEPTNHLDISTIEWLEHVVRGYRGSVVFITHDRDFLQKIATRIVEIDRGQLLSWPGNYNQYLQLKEQAIQQEDSQNALFDKRLAEEEAWIRQGVKARRKRNEGRVRALQAMRSERAQRVKRQGKARIHVESAEHSGRKVCQMRNVSLAYNGNTLIDRLNLKIMRGDRIGLIGNNGVGKSTLLKLILGAIDPDSGTIKLGTNLSLGYFDQIARELDESKTIAENVGLGREYIKINGRDRHIISYLRNFLFAPQRAMTPVRVLSGGERNRVSLAKLFTQANNLLILDEPTNDLDIEMLEVLEERLTEYQGTLLIVSHDRAFLDNITTSILVFEDDGQINEYVGGYSDWLRQGKSLTVADNSADSGGDNNSSTAQKTSLPTAKTSKLSYKLQRELDAIPEQITELEQKISALQQQISAPEFHQQDYQQSEPVLRALGQQQQQLDALTERWLSLEGMAGQ